MDNRAGFDSWSASMLKMVESLSLDEKMALVQLLRSQDTPVERNEMSAYLLTINHLDFSIGYDLDEKFSGKSEEGNKPTDSQNADLFPDSLIEELIIELDRFARDCDEYGYGLPVSDTENLQWMNYMVKDKLKQ